MRKLLILIGLLVAFQLQGQLVRTSVVASQGGAARTYLTVLNDGNTKGWYMYGDGSATYMIDDGTNITTWEDQSGSGNDVVNASGTDRPFIDDVNLEIDFNPGGDGTDDNLYDGTFTITQPATIYMVVRQNARTNTYRFLTTNVLYMSQGAADANWVINAGNSLVETHGVQSAYGIITAVFNSTSSIAQWNNNTATTGNAGTGGAGSLYVGFDTNSAQMSVKELIIRSGIADTEADRTLIKNYLNAKYSLY